MAEVGDNSKSKQIRMMLYVIGAGILSAAALMLFMLYHYNPNGAYLARNVLLDPEIAYGLQYAEGSSKGAGKVSFDRIDFAYYDTAARTMKKVSVDKGKYAQFYNLVKDQTSLVDADDHVTGLFNTGHPAMLTVKVNVAGDKTAQAVFSEVDIAEGSDYFRVLLRQQGAGSAWAYFYSPGIYAKAAALFTGN